MVRAFGSEFHLFCANAMRLPWLVFLQVAIFVKPRFDVIFLELEDVFLVICVLKGWLAGWSSDLAD